LPALGGNGVSADEVIKGEIVESHGCPSERNELTPADGVDETLSQIPLTPLLQRGKSITSPPLYKGETEGI
jgi:hypothetical protein